MALLEPEVRMPRVHIHIFPATAAVGAVVRWLGIALAVAVVALVLATALDLRGYSDSIPRAAAGPHAISSDAGPTGSTPSAGPVGQTSSGGPDGSTGSYGPNGSTGSAGP